MLEPGDVVTDFALAPPPLPGASRALAVALRRALSGPILDVFDAGSGLKIGRLSGHTDAIRSLAFSGDGRWLLSASDDRTVSAWDALELASSTDRTLKGVKLKQANAGLVVSSVDPKGPLAAEDLKPDDRITSIHRANKWDSVGTPRQLADAIFEFKPGDTVWVLRLRGGASKVVRFEVAKAVAERKPMLSLFLDEPGGASRWLAWTPSGSYDRSDQAVEGLIGFHFNPPLPGGVVRFASVADYRDRRSPGLVRRRFFGDPPPPPPPPIRAELRIVPDPLDLARPGPPRNRPIALRLALLDPIPPNGLVASASWSLDGGPSMPLDAEPDDQWSAKLPDCAPRAWHSVEVKLVTTEPSPRVITVVERFQYLPEPPPIDVARLPVPEIDRIAIDPPGPDVFDAPDGSPPTLTLSATLRANPGAPSAQASIAWNEANMPDLTYDRTNQQITAKILPKAGRNEIRLRLTNDKGGESSSAPLVVNYKRPPRVVSVTRSDPGVGPAADLTAEVDSPESLVVSAARFQREWPGSQGPGEVVEVPVVPEIRRGGPGRWIIAARGLPLDPGENRFLVWAASADGHSLEPGRSAVIIYTKPPQHRLSAEFVSPARDSAQSTAGCLLEFRARSTVRLVKVSIAKSDESGKVETVFPPPGHPIDGGQASFEGRVEAPLAKGVNTFTLTAIDDQGLTARDVVTVAYEPPPLLATVDSLVVDGREIRPVPASSGKPTFPGVLAESWVTLRGTVRWPDEEARRASPEVTVSVLVDGSPWWRGRVSSSSGLTRPFEMGLRLPSTRSVLSLQLTEAAVDERAAVHYVVNCRPESLRRWLRLLVVGVRPDDRPESLRQEALDAFRAVSRKASQAEFDAPGFEKGFLYGPLTGEDAERSRVLGQLDRIRGGLSRLDEETNGSPSEVIVIYYRGVERDG